MQFTVPVHITLNDTQQVLTVHCTSTHNIWTCQAVTYTDCIGVNTDLQSAIKEVIDNVKTSNPMVQTSTSNTEM